MVYWNKLGKFYDIVSAIALSIGFWIVSKISVVLLFSRTREEKKPLITFNYKLDKGTWFFVFCSFVFYFLLFYFISYYLYFLPILHHTMTPSFLFREGADFDFFHVLCDFFSVGWEYKSVKGSVFVFSEEQDELLKKRLRFFDVGNFAEKKEDSSEVSNLKFFFLSQISIFSMAFAPLSFVDSSIHSIQDSAGVLNALFSSEFVLYSTWNSPGDLVLVKSIYVNFWQYLLYIVYDVVPYYLKHVIYYYQSLDFTPVDRKLEWIYANPWDYFSMEKQLAPIVWGDEYDYFMEYTYWYVKRFPGIFLSSSDEMFHYCFDDILNDFDFRDIEHVGLFEIFYKGYVINKDVLKRILEYNHPGAFNSYKIVRNLEPTSFILEGVGNASLYVFLSFFDNFVKGGSGLFYVVCNFVGLFPLEKASSFMSGGIFLLMTLLFLMFGVYQLLLEFLMCIVFWPLQTLVFCFYYLLYSFSPGILLPMYHELMPALHVLLFYYFVVAVFIGLVALFVYRNTRRFIFWLYYYSTILFGTLVAVRNFPQYMEATPWRRTIEYILKAPRDAKLVFRRTNVVYFFGTSFLTGFFILHVGLYILLLPHLHTFISWFIDFGHLCARPLGFELGPYFMKHSIFDKGMIIAQEGEHPNSEYGTLVESFYLDTIYSSQKTEIKGYIGVLLSRNRQDIALLEYNALLGIRTDKYVEAIHKYMGSQQGIKRRTNFLRRATECHEFVDLAAIDRRYSRFKLNVVFYGRQRRFEAVDGPQIQYVDLNNVPGGPRTLVNNWLYDDWIAGVVSDHEKIRMSPTSLKKYYELSGTDVDWFSNVPRAFLQWMSLPRPVKDLLESGYQSGLFRWNYDPVTFNSILRRGGGWLDGDEDEMTPPRGWLFYTPHFYGFRRLQYHNHWKYLASWVDSFRLIGVKNFKQLNSLTFIKPYLDEAGEFPLDDEELEFVGLPVFFEGENRYLGDTIENEEDRWLSIEEIEHDSNFEEFLDLSYIPAYEKNEDIIRDMVFFRWSFRLFFFWCYSPIALYYLAKARRLTWRNELILRRALWGPLFVFAFVEMDTDILEWEYLSYESLDFFWEWIAWDRLDSWRNWALTVASVPTLDYYVCNDRYELALLDDQMSRLVSRPYLKVCDNGGSDAGDAGDAGGASGASGSSGRGRRTKAPFMEMWPHNYIYGSTKVPYYEKPWYVRLYYWIMCPFGDLCEIDDFGSFENDKGSWLDRYKEFPDKKTNIEDVEDVEDVAEGVKEDQDKEKDKRKDRYKSKE